MLLGTIWKLDGNAFGTKKTIQIRCLAEIFKNFFLLIFVKIVENWKPIGVTITNAQDRQDVFLYTYSSTVEMLEN